MGRAFNDAWTLLKQLPDIRELEEVLRLYNQAKASGAISTPEQVEEFRARRELHQSLSPEEREFMANKILNEHQQAQQNG